MILLISASQVARITGMSHPYPGELGVSASLEVMNALKILPLP
jgi:hypothetical protein